MFGSSALSCRRILPRRISGRIFRRRRQLRRIHRLDAHLNRRKRIAWVNVWCSRRPSRGPTARSRRRGGGPLPIRILLLIWRLATFNGLPAIHQHPFHISKRHVRGSQHRRHAAQESHSIVIRQNIRRIIRPHHDVAHRGERNTLRWSRLHNRRRHDLRLFFLGLNATRRQQRRASKHCGLRVPRGAAHLNPPRESPTCRHPPLATACARDSIRRDH